MTSLVKRTYQIEKDDFFCREEKKRTKQRNERFFFLENQWIKRKLAFFFFGQEVLKSLIWIFLCYSDTNRKYIPVYAICFNCSLFFLHETEKKVVFG